VKDFECSSCGWWDIAMKYSPTVIKCTKCGCVLLKKKLQYVVKIKWH